MKTIATKEDYKKASKRIEILLKIVNNKTDKNDANFIELQTSKISHIRLA